MAHAFNPRQRQADLFELETSLVYRGSSRTTSYTKKLGLKKLKIYIHTFIHTYIHTLMTDK